MELKLHMESIESPLEFEIEVEFKAQNLSVCWHFGQPSR